MTQCPSLPYQDWIWQVQIEHSQGLLSNIHICKYESLPVGWHLPLHIDQADTHNESERAKLMVSINMSFVLNVAELWVWQTSVSLVASLVGSCRPMLHSSFLFLKRLFTNWAPLSRTVCKHTCSVFFNTTWLSKRNKQEQYCVQTLLYICLLLHIILI